MKKFSEVFPVGAEVEAFDDVRRAMLPGTITTHTTDMQSRVDGLIVRFEDGHTIEYGTEFLDVEKPEKSFVQVKK